MIATVLMMVIGVSVQLSFWDAVPAWHHYVFFAAIIGGIYLGGAIRERQTGTARRWHKPRSAFPIGTD